MRRFRTINRKARTAFLHLTLVVSSLFFALPFFWLLSTSCKVPEEMLPVRWLPQIPPAVIQSPYIALRDNDNPAKPPALDEEAWNHLLPLMRQAIHSGIQSLNLPGFYASALQRTELTDGILLRLLRRTPEDLFSRPEKSLLAWFREEIDIPIVEEVFETIYRRMAVSDVVFRAQDVTIEDRIPGDECPWKVISGEAEIIERTEGLHRTEKEIHYNFRNHTQFALQAVVPLSIRPEDLAKISIGYRGDRSWHAISAIIETAGKKYTAIQPSFLSTGQWQETTWRIDDNKPAPMNIRTWIWLQETASSFTDSSKARITLQVDYCPPWKSSCYKLTNNYREVLRLVPMLTYIKNSTILVMSNVIGQVLASSLVAFAFARLRWPARDFCFMLMLATLMIPHQVTLVPQFLIFKSLGWYNTLVPLWIGAFFGSPFFIFLLRQFMRGIPTDLEDSAKIDGSGYFGIYWRIILPLVKPALAAIGIFTFLGVWNDFMGPLIYLNDQKLYPLSMGVFALQVFQVGNYGLMMAASVLMTLPVIALFFFAQRHFIQGITLTGLKG
ncbi:MAG: carbohydrate ABC transporter permease [Candidatus Omnitrophica bacterium]|nr:carbohydrate ABC transporter permease [Candidatus Omnitrophota bacterium]MCK6495451.1 carbohydrate ABC transporter permease [bacterium]NUP91717.1 carbohydrate ABC transporter permease [Candidatus Omnitrophota bacterium]